VQQNWAAPPSVSSTLNVAYNAAQTAGNLNVVVVGWNDASAQVQSVTDTRGNPYALAVGPTVRTGVATQSIYYAKNIGASSGGANSVRVTFDRAAAYPDVRIAEYSGLDTIAPVDVVAASTGNSSSSDSGFAVTMFPNELLIGANLVLTSTNGAGPGFTSRAITSPDGDILEDRVVTAMGSYQATAPIGSGQWVMQMVAFKAAGAGGGSATPDLVLTKQHGGSFAQGQRGAAYTLTARNAGTAATTGTVTVTDTLPSGLTASAISGAGWTCSLSGLQCTRSDALAAGSSYPSITLTVNVAVTSPASVTNSATVSGGGDAIGSNNTASDPTTITSSPSSDITPPSAPGNLVTSGITSSQVVVSWAASSDDVGVAGYHVFRNGAQIGTTSQTTYQDAGVSPATTYSYRVDAFDAAGNVSPLSSAISATTTSSTSQPGTPTLVQHVAGGMDNNFATTLKISLPNPAGAGNAMILGVRFNAAGSIASVSDDRGNSWLTGPTVTNSSVTISSRMNLYYALNIAAGTQTITIAFNGLGGPGGSYGFPQAVISEFYNVATVSAFDGMSGNASARSAGAITTTSAGDLIYEWGTDVSAGDFNYGVQFNGTSITAGAGFTLLSADLQTGSADQFAIQTSAGTIGPTFSASGSDVWSSLAIALKSASSGTPPPPGIRIVHVQHQMVAWPGHTTPANVAFPSSGNLLVGLFTSTIAFIGGVTDSNGNAWLSAASTPGPPGGNPTGAQIVYAPNASTGSTLTNISLNLSPACSSGDCNLVLYDIAGATTSPFDKARTATGNQLNAGPVTMTSLTTAAGNELTLAVASINFHTINAANGAGYVLDSQVNAFDDNNASPGTHPSRLDMDNAFAHIYTASPSTVTFSFSATTRTSSPSGISFWGSVAAAFFGVASAPDSIPPSIPDNLAVHGVSASQINLSWSASTDNVGVAGYRIYRNGSWAGNSTSTSYADTGLSGQTTYSYTVVAFDAAGNLSAQSAPVSASTTYADTTSPSVPANLRASNVTSNAATLSWDASTDDFGVTGYRIFRGGTLLTTTSATSFTDTGLAASTTYSYSVAAFDASGNVSPASTPLNVTTAAASGPSAVPAFVQLKESSATANTRSVSTGAFGSPVSSGNLVVVWIWYNSATQNVASVTDTAGNAYAIAVGPTTGTGGMAGWRQELWYAKNIVGASNLNVTATFTGTFYAEKSVTAHEYSGVDPVSPLDVTAAAATSVANASSGSATTRSAGELVFAAALFQTSGGAGAGFTQRSSIASNASEDRVVSSTGAYAGLFTNSAQSAIVQMATFKAAAP
jgi:uncharacterized repeat protein (TIGR01451 family)